MIRIVIADDQQTIRYTLQSYLGTAPSLEVVGLANDGQQAINQVAQLRPDVVLLDLEMPNLDGIAAARQIRDRFSDTKILILTIQDDKQAVVNALQSGANGYLLKAITPDRLIAAIQAVHRGCFVMGQDIFEQAPSMLTTPTVLEAERLPTPTTSLVQMNSIDGGALATATSSAIALPPPQPVFDRPVVLRQSPVWTHVILWSILGATVAFVAWAMLFKIEEAIQATGQLEPQGTVKEVQTPIAGVVETVYIKDGQAVKKGDVLLRLNPKANRSAFISLQNVRNNLVQENEFYRQQMSPAGTASFNQAVAVSPDMISLTQNRRSLLAENQLFWAQLNGTSTISLTPAQRLRFQSDQQEAVSRTNAARLDIDQLQKQLTQADIKLTSTKESLAIDQGILDDIAPVAKEGAIPKVQYLNQLQKVQQQQAEIERLIEEQKRLKFAISQAGEKLTNTESSSSKELLAAIAANDKNIAAIDSQLSKATIDNQKKIAEIDSQLSQVKLNLSYQELHAPVDGIVFDLKSRAPGFVANASDVVLKIVPSESLVAKVYITNRDIGFVKVAMPVDARIDAFPFSQYGDIKGQVSWIGSDALPPTEVRPFYSFPAKIKLNNQVLKSGSKNLKLQSGMSVSTNIRVRDRTIMSIFTESLTKEFDNLKQIR